MCEALTQLKPSWGRPDTPYKRVAAVSAGHHDNPSTIRHMPFAYNYLQKLNVNYQLLLSGVDTR
jgi:hypothetical protein